MSQAPGINEFFDINKFPKEPGIVYFALSMPLLNSTQNPQRCYEADQHLISKIQVSNVGAQVVYTDSLYLYSPERAADLKIKYQKIIEEHKQGWLHLIKQNIHIVPSGFTFMTWSQLLLDAPKFSSQLISFRRIYDTDQQLRAYIEADIEGTGREVNDYTVAYMLEEVLADYLVVKGRVRLQNEYTKDREEWILNCYHGKPHRSYVYMLQQNLLGIDNEKNIYQNAWYDLLNKKLYQFERLDIETFDFSKS